MNELNQFKLIAGKLMDQGIGMQIYYWVVEGKVFAFYLTSFVEQNGKIEARGLVDCIVEQYGDGEMVCRWTVKIKKTL